MFAKLMKKNNSIAASKQLNRRESISRIRRSSKKSIKEPVSLKINKMVEKLSGKKNISEKIEEDYIENRYFEKFYLNEILNAFYSFFSILSSVSYFEFNISSSQNSNYLLYLYSCSYFSICLVFNFIFEEIMNLEYDKVRMLVAKHENLFTSGRYKWILIKFVIFFLHPNPVTHKITYESYNEQIDTTSIRKLNNIFCLVVLLRFYFIFRLLIYLSGYMNPESDRICKQFFFEKNFKYSFKCLIQTSPLTTYITTIFILIICFGFSIRVFELDVADSALQVMWNSMYYVVVTMTTVGYGDMYAVTNEGRTIAMVSCICGIFLISLMIISINKILEMTNIEVNALTIMERIYFNQELDNSAKLVFLNLQKVMKENKKLKKTPFVGTKNFANLQMALKNFNHLNTEAKRFKENNINTVYNSISIILKDQDSYSRFSDDFTSNLKTLHYEMMKIHNLIKNKNK